MRICIIFNPTARGDKARCLRQALADLAHGATWRPTPGPGTASALATAAADEGFDVIVAAGGDGTVSEVADGIGSATGGLERCRLGIIPLGTVNVFAKELGLPARAVDAWRVIRAGRETRVDLPWLEFAGDTGRRRRYFVQLAGAGLDSRAIAGLDWNLKKRVGPLAYLWSGLAAIRGPQPRIRIVAGDHEFTGELVLVGNGRYYGGRIPLFPRAGLCNGLLDVRVFPRANWPALFQTVASTLPGGRVPASQPYLRVASLRLDCAEPMPIQLDGDNVGHLPAEFGVCAAALRVLGP